MKTLLALLLLIPSLSLGNNTNEEPITIEEIEKLNQQIYSCLNLNAGVKDLRNLKPIINIKVNPDRTVKSAELINKDELSNPNFKIAAQASLKAINNPKCSPLALPEGKYSQWKEITFTFDFSWMFEDTVDNVQNLVIDDYFMPEDCSAIQINQAICEKNGIKFFGRFKDQKKDSLGVYTLKASEIVRIKKIAEHLNGKINGIGQTLILVNDDFSKPENNWIQKYTVKLQDYLFPLVSEITGPGIFEDQLYNYSIIGKFQAPSQFIEDHYYLLDYSISSENNNYSGKAYQAKIDFDTLTKQIKKPKDGLAAIKWNVYDEKEQRLIWSKYIGFIKDGLPDGYGLIQNDLLSPRKAEEMNIPAFEYYNPTYNENVTSGLFSKGKLIEENFEIFDAVDINEFERELYSNGWYWAVLIDEKNDFEYSKKPLLDFINRFIDNY